MTIVESKRDTVPDFRANNGKSTVMPERGKTCVGEYDPEHLEWNNKNR